MFTFFILHSIRIHTHTHTHTHTRETMLVDPSCVEEEVCEGTVTVAMNVHNEICAIHGLGGIPLTKAQVSTHTHTHTHTHTYTHIHTHTHTYTYIQCS